MLKAKKNPCNFVNVGITFKYLGIICIYTAGFMAAYSSEIKAFRKDKVMKVKL